VNVAESEKRITVRISESLHRKVKAKAALSGKSISDVLREYLEAWVEEPVPEPEKED
jgi:predicted HicB family RNase H-like nuclease